ncbi:MAG: alpha/beta hydrolase, partial [Gemmataceae bacterium]
RCLRVGGEDLWQRYDNMENLLFREEDFRQPGKSRLLRELWDIKDRDTRHIVGHLLLASQGPLRVVPALDDLLDDSGIRPLSDGEEARINDLLDDAVYSVAENAKAASRRATTVLAAAAPTVTTVALTDTRPITMEPPNGEPPLQLKKTGETQRRSFAEIDLDSQPPTAPAPPKKPFDVAHLADFLVSLLSRPAWLAALGALALVCFLVVNVLVWSSVKQPATTDTANHQPASDKADEPRVQPTPRETTHASSSDPAKRGSAETVAKRSLETGETKEDGPAKVREEILSVRLKAKTPASLSVEAGEKGELQVLLDRKGPRGDVQLRLEDLPDGATARPVVVAAANDSAIVTVETNVETERGEHAVKLLVRVNEKTLDQREITLTVQRPRGRQENVHFVTVDHIELAGTLYHGWKGKMGMTVLMLHDLGRNRNTPGWRRLAEALQAEGHTVLTFDFRGHGDSKKVLKEFWTYSVNKSLPYGPDQKRRNQLTADRLPTKYLPWLIEDIAAARTYLDLRHDDPDSPVNTFNLIVIGAGKASALGSLWLASEGLRFNAADVGDKIMLKPPEKQSVRQAVWIGMEDPLKMSPFGVHSWLRGAHEKPVVPITFIYGADDRDASNLLAKPIHDKLGKELVLRKTGLSGQHLLDDDAGTARQIQRYLVKTLQKLPPEGWVPRKIKKLRSYWALPDPGPAHVRLFVAKRPGEEVLSPPPMHRLGIPIDGLAEQPGFVPELPKR